MGRLNNTTLFSFNSKKCPCSLFQAELSSCCHDETEIVKIEDDQQVQIATQTNSPSFFLIETLTFNELSQLLFFDHSLLDSIKLEKPLTSQIPIYKWNCFLTFYSEDDLID